MSFEFTALILRQSADGIAGLATSQLFERHPDGLVDDFNAWKGQIRTQVLQLAVCLQTQNPQGFADHVAWSRVALQARQIPDGAILASVECLAEVARESVPSEMVPELNRFLRLALECFDRVPVPAQSLLAADGMAQNLAKDFLAALKSGQEQVATDLIVAAHTQRAIPVGELIEEVLTPALQEVGRLWHMGQATIAEEHFISQATRTALAQLLAAAPKPPSNGKTALLSSVAEEPHSFGIQAVAAHLQLAGWRTVCLGSDTPVAELVDAAQHFSADVILLSVTVDLQIPNLIETIQQIRRELPGKRVVVGGSAFHRNPTLGQQVAADGEARNGPDAVRLANQWVS